MTWLSRLFGWGALRREAAGQPIAPPPAPPAAIPVHVVGDPPPVQPAPVPLAPVLDYASWEMVPPSEWIWPHFTPRELACKGTGRLRIQRSAIGALQALRRDLNRPLVILSAYRSPEHNRRGGGAPNSRHMEGDAFDVVMSGHDPVEFEAAARRFGFRGFGYYPRSSPPFMHIDMGAARVWGERFRA